jgi:hypothetical protein
VHVPKPRVTEFIKEGMHISFQLHRNNDDILCLRTNEVVGNVKPRLGPSLGLGIHLT